MKNALAVLSIALIVGCATHPKPPVPPFPPVQPPGMLFRATQPLPGSTVTLAWSESTTNFAGFKIYQGVASKTYTVTNDVGAVTNATVSVIPGVTNFFSATCYDKNGLQSPFSNEITYAVPVAQPQNVYALITAYLETSTNGQFSGWSPAFIFSGMVITNPPSPIFYRSRIQINYQTNAP